MLSTKNKHHQDERDSLRTRLLEQQHQLQVLEDTRADLESRLAQTVADHSNANHTLSVTTGTVGR